MPKYSGPAISVKFVWTPKTIERLFRRIEGDLPKYRILFDKGLSRSRRPKWKLYQKLFIGILDKSKTNRAWKDEVFKKYSVDPAVGLSVTPQWEFRDPLDRKFLALRDQYETNKAKFANFRDFDSIPEEMRVSLKRLSPWHFHFQRILQETPILPAIQAVVAQHQPAPERVQKDPSTDARNKRGCLKEKKKEARSDKAELVNETGKPKAKKKKKKTKAKKDKKERREVEVEVEEKEKVKDKEAIRINVDPSQVNSIDAASDIQPDLIPSDESPTIIDLTMVDETDDEDTNLTTDERSEAAFDFLKMVPALSASSEGIARDGVKRPETLEESHTEVEGTSSSKQSVIAEDRASISGIPGRRRFQSLARSPTPFIDLPFPLFPDEASPPSSQADTQPPVPELFPSQRSERTKVVRGWRVAASSSPEPSSEAVVASAAPFTITTSSKSTSRSKKRKNATIVDYSEESDELAEIEVVPQIKAERAERPNVKKAKLDQRKDEGTSKSVTTASDPEESSGVKISEPKTLVNDNVRNDSVDGHLMAVEKVNCILGPPATKTNTIVEAPLYTTKTTAMSTVEVTQRKPLFSPVIELGIMSPVKIRSYIPIHLDSVKHGVPTPASETTPDLAAPTVPVGASSTLIGPPEAASMIPPASTRTLLLAPSDSSDCPSASKDLTAVEGTQVPDDGRRRIEDQQHTDTSLKSEVPVLGPGTKKRKKRSVTFNLAENSRSSTVEDHVSRTNAELLDIGPTEKLARARASVFQLSWFAQPVDESIAPVKLKKRTVKERCRLFSEGLQAIIATNGSDTLTGCRVLVEAVETKPISGQAANIRELVKLAGGTVVQDQRSLLDGPLKACRVILCSNTDKGILPVKKENGKTVSLRRLNALDALRWIDDRYCLLHEVRETPAVGPTHPRTITAAAASPSSRKGRKRISFATIPENRFYGRDVGTYNVVSPSDQSHLLLSAQKRSILPKPTRHEPAQIQDKPDLSNLTPAKRIAKFISWGKDKSTQLPQECSLEIHLKHDEQRRVGSGTQHLSQLRCEWLHSAYAELQQNWIGKTTVLKGCQVMLGNTSTIRSVPKHSVFGRKILDAGGRSTTHFHPQNQSRIIVVPPGSDLNRYQHLRESHKAEVMTELDFMLYLDGRYRQHHCIPEEILQEEMKLVRNSPAQSFRL